ncbi:MAG: branched-chain amino acid ABC transporter permease [Thermoanaerobaculia bacterium]
MLWLAAFLLSLPLVGVYAIFAIGIVLIYRASKVLNLAHGVMATAPAYILYTLDSVGLPLALSLPLAVASGGALGWAVERVFVRPFRKLGATAQTVGTVVVLGLGIALMARLWGTSALEAVTVFPQGHIGVDLSNIRFGEIGLFAAMLAIFAGLTALFRYTELGLLLRGAAENPTAAALHGVNPQRMTALTWVIGGALAGIAGILLAAVTVLQPYTLPLQALPGFLAALIGGLGSVTGGLVGAAAVGLVIGLVPFLPVLGTTQGAAQLLLAVGAMIIMASRGTRLSTAETSSGLGT